LFADLCYDVQTPAERVPWLKRSPVISPEQERQIDMKKLALGFAAALISTAAFAQNSPGQNPAPGRASGSPSISGPDSPSMPNRDRGGSDQSASERKHGGAARVGAHSREDGSLSVKRRSVTDTREGPSVTTTHRRTVRNVQIQQDEPTVVKRKIVRKKHRGKVVVSTRQRYGAKVQHGRRTVRRIETNEPSVSVTRRRTTVQQGGSVAVRGQARHSTDVKLSGSRLKTTTQSGSQSPSTRQPGSGPDTTGPARRFSSPH